MTKASLFSAIFFPLLVAQAATIAPTETALRNAIAAGGEINFSSAGTVSITAVLEINADVTIDGTGPVVLNGHGATILFKVNPGKRLTLRRVGLLNGRHRGADMGGNRSAEGAYGGAIRNFGGDVTLESCVVTDCSVVGGDVPLWEGWSFGGSASGGAVFQSAGSLTIINSRFGRNTATAGYGAGSALARGGAIYAQGGSVSISAESEFHNNSVFGGSSNGIKPSGGDAAGGAIYVLNSSSLTVVETRFEENRAVSPAISPGMGGAIAVGDTPFTLESSFLLKNVAVGGMGLTSGGGIFNGYGRPGLGGAVHIDTGVAASIRRSTFQANVTHGGRDQPRAGYPDAGAESFGGAVYNRGAALIENCTFAENAAWNYLPDGPASGGAIYSAGSLTLNFCTIAHNDSVGPILAREYLYGAGSASITANIFGPNNGRADNVSPAFTDNGFNISSDSTPAFTQPTSANNLNPLLGPLRDFGGPTPTIPILGGSPAIDRVSSNMSPATDQRGRARPYGAHPDAGAFESSAPFTIIGRIRGHQPLGISIYYSDLQTSPGDDGIFLLSHAQPGEHRVRLEGEDTIFRPSDVTLNVQADIELNVRGFRLRHFALDPDFAAPTFTFAGGLNETWDFFTSHDLISWSPAGSHTFNNDAPFSIPIGDFPKPIYLNASRR